MFSFLARRSPVAAADAELPDATLQQALRSLPVPAPGPDFDRKVLAAVAAHSPRTRRSWAPGLPRLAVAALVTLLLFPATRGILNAGVQMNWNFYFSKWLLMSPGKPDSAAVAHSERWVAELGSPLKREEKTQFPVVWDYFDMNSPLNEYHLNHRSALRRVHDQYAEQASFVAARLRHTVGDHYPYYDRAGRRIVALAALNPAQVTRVNEMVNPGDELLARQGEKLDPNNAFFPAMRSVILSSQRRDTDAIAALQATVDKPFWNDYGAEEITARYRRETSRPGLSVLTTHNILDTPTIPREALGALARWAMSQAAQQERVGRRNEGAAIRVAVLDLASKIMRDAHTSEEQLAAMRMIALASRSLGGWEPAFAGPRPLPATAVDQRALAAHRIEHQRNMRRRAAWEEQRPARLAAFLRANGQEAHADWAQTLLRTCKVREAAVRRYWEERAATPGESPHLRLVRLAWICLPILAAGCLVSLLLGAALTQLPRTPLLARREEFPSWVLVGGVIGVVCALSAMTLDGLFNMQGASLPLLLPAALPVTLGVGFLCLRRVKGIVLSSLIAAVAFCLVVLLHRGANAMLLKAAFLWTGYPDIINYPVTRPAPPYGAWVSLPLALLLLTVTAGLWSVRHRQATWQAACRSVAAHCIPVASVFALLFALNCVGTWYAERALEQQALSERWNEAKRWHVSPVPSLPK